MDTHLSFRPHPISFARSLFVGLVLFSLGLRAAVAQDSPSEPQQQPASHEYCSGTVGPMPHAEVLINFCTWVLSFDKRLPDIIGDQETHRYSTDNGKDRKLIDTTSARLAYVRGRSRFSDVAINHVKIAQTDESNEMLKLHGAWSYGDYGTDLRLLFRTHANAKFSFVGENKWESIPVYVFAFEVPENHWWQMKAREAPGKPLQTALPTYRGKILLDQKNGSLVHFERETMDIDKHFPLRYGANSVDYRLLPLGDGSSFVLPVKSTVTFCHDDKHHKCEINEASFTNWQKFAAKTRILTDTETE